MRNVKGYLFVSVCYTLSMLCGACGLLQRDSAKGDSDSASEAAPATTVSAQAPEKPEKPQKAAGNPFGITSTIVPATMPLAGTGAAAAMSPAAASAANAAAASAAASGSGAVAAAAGNGAEAAGDGAMAAAAGTSGAMTSASSAFDPATFDEAHGRSKGTAPLGTPVEEGGMECSAEVCKPLPPLPDQATAAGASISLCCSPEGECGTMGMGPMSMMMGGSTMNEPPKCRIIPDSDPQCARLIVMDFEIASCCTPDGKCGINSDGFMMAQPCTSIEDAMANIGQFITLPPPASCLPGMGPPHSSSAPAPGSSTTAGDAGVADMSAAGSGASAPVAGSGASAPTAGSPATQSSAGSAAP